MSVILKDGIYEFISINYDPIALIFTLKVKKTFISFYSKRRTDQKYDIEETTLNIYIKKTTPQVKELFDQNAPIETIVNSIKSLWIEYTEYAVNEINKTWVIYKSTYDKYLAEKLTIEEVCQHLNILSDTISQIATSPYIN